MRRSSRGPSQRLRAAESAAKKPPAGDRPLKTLERVLSKAGVASRTDARKIIAAGRVTVQSVVVRDPDHWVDLERDLVLLDGAPLRSAERLYLTMHKPVGYLTTHRDRDERPTIYDLLPESSARHLFSVGRLDLDTSGLLLLTNDSDFSEKMTNPTYKVPKTYLVKAIDHLDDDQLQRLRDGVVLKDGPTRPAVVKRLSEGERKSVIELTISEGRNRQVRRMLEAVGSKVHTLARVRFGPLELGDLGEGKTRALTADEVQALLQAASR